MNRLLRVGALSAPRLHFSKVAGRVTAAGARRTAGLAAALVLVAGAGTGSALFVDYLAERAELRAAQAAPAKASAEVPTFSRKVSTIVREAGFHQPSKLIAANAIATASDLQRRKTETEVSGGAMAPAAVPADFDPDAAKAVIADAAPELIEAGDDTADVELDDVASDGAEELASDMEVDEVSDETVTAAVTPADVEPAADEQELAPAIAATGDVASLVKPDAKPTHVGRVKKHVNLRSGPADEAKVLTVVPAKASVNVLSCKGWCEVEYQGKRGWIYKSFIRT